MLSVRNLSTYFFLYRGVMKVLNGISFDIRENEIFGLVGESGSGKTVTAFSILRLIEEPGRIVGGEILFENRNLLQLSEREMEEIRGKKISMIFQQAKTALNPFMRVGDQIARVYRVHEKLDKKESKNRAVEILRKTGIPEPDKRIRDYPHQFSGGMCQRAMISIMTACSPDLLIADEPTTGLDVMTQAQILDLMKKIRDEKSSSILLITHDLGIVAQTCDRVAVMHAGQVVEIANVKDIFNKPKHPYTIGLLESIPRHDRKQRVKGISGSIPSLINIPSQCRFSSRCTKRMSICSREKPPMIEVKPEHYVTCHLFT